LDTCVHKKDCGIRSIILGLHEIVHNALSQITLADVIASEKTVDKTFHRIQRLSKD